MAPVAGQGTARQAGTERAQRLSAGSPFTPGPTRDLNGLGRERLRRLVEVSTWPMVSVMRERISTQCTFNARSRGVSTTLRVVRWSRGARNMASSRVTLRLTLDL